MRVRILRTVYYDGRKHYHAGDVVDAPESQASAWLAAGIAMQDKSEEPAEVKAEATPKSKTAEPKTKRKKK